jgi:phage baseplate assembly protein W
MPTSEASFLGTGWSFPPTFQRDGFVVVMVSGDLDIRESLDVLFSTWLGERLMVPQYGTDLWRRVFGTMSVTVETDIAGSVRQSILMWEPRIDVLDVTVSADATRGGAVYINVDYLVRATNTRNNIVFPFYLQEGTLAPPAS